MVTNVLPLIDPFIYSEKLEVLFCLVAITSLGHMMFIKWEKMHALSVNEQMP